MAWLDTVYSVFLKLFHPVSYLRRTVCKDDLEKAAPPKPKKEKRPFESYDPELLLEGAGLTDRDPDSDLWVFRRFGKLHLFNILCIQERLANLNEVVETGESWKTNKDESDELLANIQGTLEKYDNALSSLAKFKSYRRPENHILDHMYDCSHEKIRPLWHTLGLKKGGGSLYLDDLAAIGAVEKSWVHRFIDQHDWCRRLFEEKRLGDDEDATLIYFEANVKRAETILLHVSFWFLLFCPVIVLSNVDSKLSKLFVIAGFLLAASLLSASLLNAPNRSSLGLVAGYAAILVVFMTSNAGQQ